MFCHSQSIGLSCDRFDILLNILIADEVNNQTNKKLNGKELHFCFGKQAVSLGFKV